MGPSTPATQRRLAREERRLKVHLLVRKTSKTEGRAAAFRYCGDLEFDTWKGDSPITVIWKLLTSPSPPAS